MNKSNRINNNDLLHAGLELMRQNGKSLTKISSAGRSMLYKMSDGSTVRARTCNDHILVTVADSPKKDARLNIEGTDWLLIVMPEEERTHGNVIAFLVPTNEAVAETRRAYVEWLASKPNTKGTNTTWNIRFDDKGAGIAYDYFKKWKKFQLNGEVSTLDRVVSETSDHGGSINDLVEIARQNIASAAGVSPQNVKISIEFAA